MQSTDILIIRLIKTLSWIELGQIAFEKNVVAIKNPGKIIIH